MKLKERRNDLMRELEEMGRVVIKEFAKKSEVSEMTIRRDLNKLSELGLVTLVHGGAVFNAGGAFTYEVTFRERQMQREKNLLGQYCATLINEGNAVWLHCGSTLTCIADALLTRQNIAVLTNSLPILNVLSSSRSIQLIASPGIYETAHKAFFGDMTQRMVKNFHIDVAFFGAEALSIENGFMASLPADAGLILAVMESARKKIIVADHTKINKTFFIKICDLREFDQIVTDNEADEDFVKKARRMGIEVTQL